MQTEHSYETIHDFCPVSKTPQTFTLLTLYANSSFKQKYEVIIIPLQISFLRRRHILHLKRHQWFQGENW